MKTLWSKKAVIALTVTNVAAASWTAYVFKDKLFKFAKSRVAHEGSMKPAGHRRGIVQPVYFKNSDELQTCYESFLLRDPSRDEGSVLVNMKITGNGEVDNLKMVQTDFDEPVFTQCILDKIKATRLPATVDKNDVMIAHRFNFRRKTATHLNFDQQ